MSTNSVPEDQLIELLLHLHKTKPEEARSILNQQPQISYALIALMVKLNAINVEAMTNQLASYGVPTGSTNNLIQPPPAPQVAQLYGSGPGPSTQPPPPQVPSDPMAPYAAATPNHHPPVTIGYPHGSQPQPATTITSRTNYINSSAQSLSSTPAPPPQPQTYGPRGWGQRGEHGGSQGGNYGVGPGGGKNGGPVGNYGGGLGESYGGGPGEAYGDRPGGGYGGAAPSGAFGGGGLMNDYVGGNQGGNYRRGAPGGGYNGGGYSKNSPGPGPSGYRQPQPPGPGLPQPASMVPESLSHLPEDQKALLMRMVSMSPEEIHRLPPAERANVIQLRATLGLPTS